MTPNSKPQSGHKRTIRRYLTSSSIAQYMNFLETYWITRDKEADQQEVKNDIKTRTAFSYSDKATARDRYEELNSIVGFIIIVTIIFFFGSFILATIFFIPSFFTVMGIIFVASLALALFAGYLKMRTFPAYQHMTYTPIREHETDEEPEEQLAKPQHVFYNIEFILGIPVALAISMLIMQVI
jgi:hypothetical protein